LIRIVEIEIIHRQSHRRICFHLKFSVIVFFFIVSESCRICSSSKNCRLHSESNTCVMKTRITSNHFVFRTQSNDVSQISDFSQCVHSSQFWLFFAFASIDCVSFFHQLFSDILCLFDWNWTIWFVASIQIHCASKRLKQNCISIKLVCFLFSFCKKEFRVYDFVESELFSYNFQSIFSIIEESWVCIRFNFNIIISTNHILKQSSVSQSMNTFNVWVSPESKWSWSNHFHFSFFRNFWNDSSHCDVSSQSSINFYHKRWSFWIWNSSCFFFKFITCFFLFFCEDTLFCVFKNSILKNAFFLLFFRHFLILSYKCDCIIIASDECVKFFEKMQGFSWFLAQ